MIKTPILWASYSDGKWSRGVRWVPLFGRHNAAALGWFVIFLCAVKLYRLINP